MAKIIEIEGVGPATAQQFKKAGITSIEKLLTEGATKKGRYALASQTGLDEAQILRFVNMADLFRIKGVGSEYAELLKAAGVDTVKELRNRNAANLHIKMHSVNAEKKLVRQLPSLKKVEGFIDHANKLEVILTY